MIAKPLVVVLKDFFPISVFGLTYFGWLTAKTIGLRQEAVFAMKDGI